MAAIIIKWLIVIFALFNAGYMTFDGARALITGDYLRPSSGEYAGQLGPWSKLVTMIGIDPESTLMKIIFLIFGIIWFGVIICFIMDYSWSHSAMIILSIVTLWYLFTGTVICIIQIILLVVLKYLR